MTTTSAPVISAADRALLRPVAPRAPRIDTVDLLRGLVIVLMLLDHTRDFVHRDAALFDPTNLARTTVPLFSTRWVTHFCAPVFSLLAGVGAALQRLRGKSKAELSRFLLTRGLWLLVLEFTVIRFGMAFDLNYRAFPGMLEVIWALGASMIVLAAFIHLSTAAIATVGIATVLLHNLADGVVVQGFAGPGSTGPNALGAAWMLLHQPGFIQVLGAPLLVAYPLIPWAGVMLIGYVLGTVYAWEPARRTRFLTRLGLGLVVAFVMLRASNLYGDPVPWSAQPTPEFTALSFLNTRKYPASLLFLLMTLGPALLVLGWLERVPRGRVGKVLVTFGRVPLFFFVIQWYVAHPIGFVLSLLAGKPVSHLFGMPGATPPAPGAGFGLGATYLAWLAGLLITYPLCRWFAEVKRRRTEWWLSYL
ncbi:MAG TPA: heparan-alpha-glucosaminide N-acetyltransferase domain-containing protein [Gemmatimonadales bacterium]|nr:heparan-alpha-glucosaminide N-acetyltransferase domain-containing protein [Gemmatimonadales bacterium]